MSQVKAEDFPLLLEVFRDGLRYGVVSKAEVVAWADKIIAEEDEPDYFFVELSLSSDANTIIEILNRYSFYSESTIPFRVIMGLIYQKLINDDDAMTIEEATILTGSITNHDALTSFESNNIYTFEDYEFFYLPDTTLLQVEILNFLSIYKEFTLDNYNEWIEINNKVEDVLKLEKAKADVVDESNRKLWARKALIKRMWIYTVIGEFILVAVFIASVYYRLFRIDGMIIVGDGTVFYVGIFEFYFILKVVYILLKNIRKKKYSI